MTTIDRLERDGHITVIENLGESLVFRIGSLPTQVTAWAILADGKVGARVDHAILTPLQAGAYWVNDTYDWGGTSGAIEAAIRPMVRFYNAAVSAGHPPEAAWLVRIP